MSLSSPVLLSPWTKDGLASTITSAMEAYRAEVGQRLREMREARDLSQEDAAHDLNVTTKTLSRWENGRTWPYTQHWARIKDFFGADPREGIQSPGPLALNPATPAVGLDERLTRIEQKLDQLLEEDQERYSNLSKQDRELLERFEELVQQIGRDVGRGQPRSRGAKGSRSGSGERAA